MQLPYLVIKRNIEGIDLNRALEMLVRGWEVYTNVALKVASTGLVAPSGEEIKSREMVDLWIPPPVPNLPQPLLIEAMIDVENNGGDVITLGGMSARLFGAPWPAVREAFTGGTDGHPGSDLAASQPGKVSVSKPDAPAVQGPGEGGRAVH